MQSVGVPKANMTVRVYDKDGRLKHEETAPAVVESTEKKPLLDRLKRK